MGFFGKLDDYMRVQSAFESDDPERIFDSLSKSNLLTNRSWPGMGRIGVTARITDAEAIEKFLDGRYITFSAGSTTDRHVCSVCMSDWAVGDFCDHRHGKVYDGVPCVFITGKFEVLEGSVVNTPADDLSKVESMQILDKSIDLSLDNKVDPTTVYFSDSIYREGECQDALWKGQAGQKAERIQEDLNIDGQEEKEEEASEESNQEDEVQHGSEEGRVSQEVLEDKDFDHMLIISEEKMKALHEKGQADVIAVSGKQRMTIRIIYRAGKGKEEMKEDSFETIVNEFFDEKKFKVPSGAKGNAQKVLNWKKKYGSEVKGMTPVGWARARQLASQSEIPLSTVKRMAAFNRHRKNAAVDPKFKDTPWKDRGYVAWLGWGGTSGIDWAIKISAANDSAGGDIDGDVLFAELPDAKRSSPKGKGAKTPAKPSERIKGSKKNKKGSASKANSKIKVGSVLGSLKEKVSSHNKKYGKEKGKRVTLGMLKAVYRRGAGAFSSTHRPGMSRSGWGVARVNAFLKLVRSGKPSNPKYVQDNDLLPAGHPRKTSNKSK